MSRVIVQAACATAGGTQVIPLPAGALANDPKAFQFWLVPGTTNGTPVDHLILGYGVATLNGGIFTQRSVSVRSRHDRNPNKTNRLSDTRAVNLLTITSGAAQALASITAADKDSITLSWVVHPPSAYLLMVEAIDCEAAACGTVDIAPVLDTATTVTPGFEFDLLYVSTLARAIPGTRAGGLFSWGVAHYDGTTLTQLGYGRNSADSVTPNQVGAQLSTSYIAMGVSESTGAIDQALEVTNVTATTFDVITREGVFVSDADALFLALKFADDQPSAIGMAQLPGSPDSAFEIGVGLTATSFEVLATTLSTVDTAAGDGTAGAFGFGVWDGTREYSASVADEDNVATTNTESVTGENIIRVRQHNGTTGIVATVDSVAGDDVVLDITSALARQIIWTALGIPASGTITAEFSADVTSGTAPLTVTFTDESVADGVTVSEWFWEFGDGETSAEQNPVHIYNQAAVYTVSLTASGDGDTVSNTKTRIDYITVTEPPPPLLILAGVPVLTSAAMPQIPASDVLMSIEVE